MNERFLHLISETENALRVRLGNPRAQRVGLEEMIRRYRQSNHFWQREAEVLDNLRELRNYLTHCRSHDRGETAIVSQAAVDRLVQIRDCLVHPRRIEETFRKSVIAVQIDYSLSSVLQLAYSNAFSQFPVMSLDRFQGVITENEVVRWLGQQVSRGEHGFDTSCVTVRTVMEQVEPDRPRIFRFMRLNECEQVVMSLFLHHPALEVVLLTNCGTGNTPLEGIVTQWDAARHPNRNLADE